MATSTASEQVFSMAGHVINSKRPNLKSSSMNNIPFANSAFKVRTKRSRLTKTFYILLYSVFKSLLALKWPTE